MQLSFKKDLDLDLLTLIFDRMDYFGMKYDRLTAAIDFTYWHNAIDIRWLALLKADRGCFCHDIQGMMNHINRETGEVDTTFTPRLVRQGE